MILNSEEIKVKVKDEMEYREHWTMSVVPKNIFYTTIKLEYISYMISSKKWGSKYQMLQTY